MTTVSSILLVDPDPKSLRVLEVSLRKAGYVVKTACSTPEAWSLTLNTPPSLLICNIQLPGSKNFELIELYRQKPQTKNTPIVALSENIEFASRARAIELGTSGFLYKPVLVREVLNELYQILQNGNASAGIHDQEIGLEGTLAKLSLVDILQIIDNRKRSGILQVLSDTERSGGWVNFEAEGTLYFSNGQLVDSQLGNLSGPSALYRTFLWEDGDFCLRLSSVDRLNTINKTTDQLLLEGMQQVDEWNKLLSRLPTRSSIPVVDYSAFGRKFPQIPDKVRDVLHLLDGHRTIANLVENTNTPDMDLIHILHKLFDEEVLVASEFALTGHKISIDDWLSSDIPSSPVSADPTVTSSGTTEKDKSGEAQSQLPSQEPKVVLFRQRIPANKPVAEENSLVKTHPFMPRIHTYRVSSKAQLSLPSSVNQPPQSFVAGVRKRSLDFVGGTAKPPPQPSPPQMSSAKDELQEAFFIKEHQDDSSIELDWRQDWTSHQRLIILSLVLILMAGTCLTLYFLGRGLYITPSEAPLSPMNPPTSEPPLQLTSRAVPTPVPLSTPPKKDESEKYIKRGERAIQQGKLRTAKGQFRRAIRNNPEIAAGHSGLAYVYLAEENLTEAKVAAMRALRLDSGNARAYLVLGAIEQNANRMDQACTRYERYLELGGGSMSGEIRSVIKQKCRNR